MSDDLEPFETTSFEVEGPNFLEWLAKNQPEVTKLIESLTENYVVYRKSLLEAEQNLYERHIELQKTAVHDRQSISKLFIGAIVVVFALTAVLTVLDIFEGTTLSFLLGTSVGSLLTILGKVFVPNGRNWVMT
ncbi:hypothetical protein [Methanoculleus sp. UBA303]|jgi:hypothetical protein|uniref:hypothetical protein n=1 Tax=Methanoculleus sp. UBA303 TaxID=1915497 RepID=UPI0025CCDED9|nr:hypothetical protein [Methanoculleus sp. UBA303]